ncbi:MAG: TonB-dependent receptor [Marinilabiliaceae bacterium]|nr:TonB-dependent receptor [Marinilabiliaceae bacterium]
MKYPVLNIILHKDHVYKLIILTISLCLYSKEPHAQNTNNYIIEGSVIDSEEVPLPGVAVYTASHLHGTITDVNGYFTLNYHPNRSDSIEVCFRMLGYQLLQVTYEHNTSGIIIVLKPENLELKEALVTATRPSEIGSQYMIGNQAIQHSQSTHLGELMQLLPGQQYQTPTLNTPGQIVLRQAISTYKGAPSYGPAEAINSLGIKTIVDGMPLSNNANLQIYNSADSHTLNPSNKFSTVTGRGVDVRNIATENIESVKIIPGIPSAKYGDLTTGVVLVETKKGYTPWEATLKMDPRITLAGISKGFCSNNKVSSLNFNCNIAQSLKSENEADFAFKRLNTSAVFKNIFFNDNQLETTTSISFSSSFDEYFSNNINMKPEESMSSSDRHFSFSTGGKWYFNKKIFRVLNYHIGYSRQWQNSDLTKYRSESMQAVATAFKDTMMAVDIVPYTYLYDMKIEGIPTRLNARLNTDLAFQWDNIENLVTIGGEWSTDKNDGKGKIFDINNPPPLSSSQSLRPRAYNTIPSQNIFSAFLCNQFKTKILNKELTGNFGLRYDNFDPTNQSHVRKNTFWAPRLNMGFSPIKNFTIKAGWGKTAKSIPMLYLHPEKAYFDFLNLNYYKSLSGGEKEYFFLNTTRVYDTNNENLKISTSDKYELGLNYKNRFLTIDCTYFNERVDNAYSFSRLPVLLKRDKYELTEYKDKFNSDYKYIATDTLSRSYTKPDNTHKLINKGLELQLAIKKLAPIRTSFMLLGSFIESTFEQTKPIINTGSWNAKVFPVYKAGGGSYKKSVLTNLTAIHHIPALRYVVTLSMQTIWNEKNYSYYPSDAEYPIYLIKNGIDEYKLTEKEKQDYKRDLSTGKIEESLSPLFLFNLKISKEIGDHCNIMVSLNNLFFHNPIEKSERYENSFYQRNPPVYYGFKIQYKI